MYEKQIKNGAQFLDEHFSRHKKRNWRKRINIANLDMNHNTLCILGQLFKKGYNKTRERLHMSLQQSSNLGFSCAYKRGICTCSILTQEWRNYLAKFFEK